MERISKRGGKRGALEQSLSVTEATAIVNLARRTQGLPTLSWSAVENFTLRSDSVQKLSRRTKKSSKDDPDLNWSKCRLAQCQQYLEQLAYGDLVESGTPPIQLDFPPNSSRSQASLR